MTMAYHNVDKAACENDHCPKKLSCLRWQLGTNKDPHQIYLDESMCQDEDFYFYIENKNW